MDRTSESRYTGIVRIDSGHGATSFVILALTSCGERLMRRDISGFVRRVWLALVPVAALAAAVGGVCGGESEDVSTADPYPLRNCVLRNCPLDDAIEVLYVGDREIRVCCQQCVDEFSAGENAWLAVVDERIVQQQTPHYPLKNCVVDGKPLDDFNTIDKVFNNRLFRLCSDDCCAALEEQPAKYFARLNEAVIEKQKPNYPPARCIVSGEPLGKDAIDLVVGNRLIRLANAGQVDQFDENPGKYLEQLGKLPAARP